MRKLVIGAALAGAAALALVFRSRLAVLLGRARGAVTRAPEPNDPTLARNVESELFRDEHVPKGQINVNVQNGVVQLRGEVASPEMLDDLVSRARKVHGVADVESLLHLPGQEAPMHQ